MCHTPRQSNHETNKQSDNRTQYETDTQRKIQTNSKTRSSACLALREGGEGGVVEGLALSRAAPSASEVPWNAISTLPDTQAARQYDKQRLKH